MTWIWSGLYVETTRHLWSYHVHFFLEWEMFRTEVVQKVKTHFMFNNIFPKIVSFMSNVKKYATAGKSTDYNIMQRIRIVCWLNKATNIHSEYVILITFSLHQCLYERTSVLRCTYIVCFLMFLVNSQRGIHIS
jgi:hypothetical protein